MILPSIGHLPLRTSKGLKLARKTSSSATSQSSATECPKQEAIEFFKNRGGHYKVEIIKGFDDGAPISLYSQGDFIDLCRGPHVPATGQIGAFKLLSTVAPTGAGTNGIPCCSGSTGLRFRPRPSWTPISPNWKKSNDGTIASSGKELDLLSIQDEIGPGLVLWHPKGALVRLLIENFWREQHIQDGYELVYCPHIARLDLWKTSGHVDYYRENMFPP